MALVTVQDAVTQYNANLGWQTSQASAELALEAVRFLLINRAQSVSAPGRSVNWSAIESEKALLEKFLGATGPRAFGRSRVLRTNVLPDEGIA